MIKSDNAHLNEIWDTNAFTSVILFFSRAQTFFAQAKTSCFSHDLYGGSENLHTCQGTKMVFSFSID